MKLGVVYLGKSGGIFVRGINLDNLFAQFDGMAVEGGVDAAEAEDDCAGGACKI